MDILKYIKNITKLQNDCDINKRRKFQRVVNIKNEK